MVDFSRADPVEEILRLTGGRGVDVAIKALGTKATFEACLLVLQPGGTLWSLRGLFRRSHSSSRPLRRRARFGLDSQA
ncbi:zinc-binding dehydrogenase [Caulobacter sp. DWR1-3-2b1]|uniref:zinc-binding dehydrogenase n=1 Tax=Caulobacter sp. DWR1-3-2b1 TaxID=2804670 RepID=UPI003CF58315